LCCSTAKRSRTTGTTPTPKSPAGSTAPAKWARKAGSTTTARRCWSIDITGRWCEENEVKRRMKDEGGRMKEMRTERARISSSFILHPSSFPRRRGYSFPEVLFAVVVLGIGFIMIAAIFPVAISQSKATADETTAAALARSAVTELSRVADDNRSPAPQPIMPGTSTAVNAPFTGEVRPFDTADGWNA